MRRVKKSVPREEAIRRALVMLAVNPGLCKASQLAYAIWPEEKFLTSQGAGGSASRILRCAERAGLAKWIAKENDWGWHITPEGPSERKRPRYTPR